ncbi:MAG: DHH family phosphoesterase [archaeon]
MICFHHDDLDGRCSAYLVKRFIDEGDCRFVEINYDQKFPLDKIKEGEYVCIVDFSIEPEVMRKLLKKTKNVVWVDHHISAIKKYKDFEHHIPGIRNSNHAACELVFELLSREGSETPKAVKYIGDWDMWKFNYDKTEEFKIGLEAYDTSPNSKIWDEVVENPHSIVNEGEVILRYRNNFYKEYVKKYSFETEFEEYDCIVCNVGNVSSKLFDSLEDEYDIKIAFAFNGDDYIVSLYSTFIDVSIIAEKYGGGGHEGAAGFVCKRLPFKIPAYKQKYKEGFIDGLRAYAINKNGKQYVGSTGETLKDAVKNAEKTWNFNPWGGI